MELLVTYLDNPYCNTTVEIDGEWVLNEDVVCFDDVPDSTSTSSFHMPTPTSMTTCLLIEYDDESFFILSSKNGQSPIIFRRMHPQIITL